MLPSFRSVDNQCRKKIEVMPRKSIPTNIARRLWADCGGFCQNPTCQRFLFTSVEDDSVSLANAAHIIGYGKNGPRSEHALASDIDKNGLDNLIMLCLDCHKIVDELEKKFSVEAMRSWKVNHVQQVHEFFDVPTLHDEKELLIEVNDLLEINHAIFNEYGPYSLKAIEGDGGDAISVWRRRCLDTIIPNNRRIINLIEKNKRRFPYPWDVYRAMIIYKLHVDAFEDNLLHGQMVNDYRLFPIEFDHLVKTKLGIDTAPLEIRSNEELQIRHNQVSVLINRFLSDHKFIVSLEELNRATLIVELQDQRNLRVFATNTYYFSEYSFNKVMAIDPHIDAIICSNPYGGYTSDAKVLCIENGIGLFNLAEFMGAVWKKEDGFLNSILKKDVECRVSRFKNLLRKLNLSSGLKVYLFGSYLRGYIFHDIDTLIVYRTDDAKAEVDTVVQVFSKEADDLNSNLDVTVCSHAEFTRLQLKHNNLTEL